MSYIGLFNETDLSADTGTLDHMVINTVFSSMGSTLLNNTSLTGTLTGFTTIGEGETVFTYDPATRTFSVSTPIGSISNGKLVYSTIILNGITMSLGGTYTLNTDNILEGANKYYTTSRAQTDARNGQSVVNTPELLVSYNNLTGVLTIPAITTASISNTKLQNATIGLNGLNMSLGSTYTIPALSITNGMLASSSLSLNGQSMYLGGIYTLSTVNITTTTLNQNYYLPLIDSLTAGNKIMYTDSNNGIMYNPAGNLMTVSQIEVINDVNIGLGNSYKINSVAIDTDDILQGTTNKYLNSLTTGNTTEISHTYTGYNLTSLINPSSIALTKLNIGALGQLMICNALGNPVYTTLSGDVSNSLGVVTIKTGAVGLTKINTSAYATANTASTLVQRDATGNFSAGTITATSLLGSITSTAQNVFGYGNNAQGVNYSAIFGTASSTSSGQIALVDGSSTNQYAQLYCRNNVFGIQGNITTISLEKPTNITTGALSVLGGILNIGINAVANGIINLRSTLTSAGTVIQQTGNNFFIDTVSAGSINIGTAIANTLTNITNCNILGNITYNSTGKLNNVVKTSFNVFAHTVSLPNTIWSVISNTATSVPLQVNITCRNSNSYVRLTATIPLTNWGTTSSNHHMSIARRSYSFVAGENLTYDIIGSSSNYGIHHTMAGTQYDTCSMTWLDMLPNTAGTPFWYCVVARCNSSISVGSNVGNSAYADIYAEEIF